MGEPYFGQGRYAAYLYYHGLLDRGQYSDLDRKEVYLIATNLQPCAVHNYAAATSQQLCITLSKIITTTTCYHVLTKNHTTCSRHGFLHQRMNANGSDTK